MKQHPEDKMIKEDLSASDDSSTWKSLLQVGNVGVSSVKSAFFSVKNYLTAAPQKLKKELTSTTREIDKVSQHLEDEEEQIKRLEMQLKEEQQRFIQLQAEKIALVNQNNKKNTVSAEKCESKTTTPVQFSSQFFSADTHNQSTSNQPLNRQLAQNNDRIELAEQKSRDLDNQVTLLEEASGDLLKQQEQLLREKTQIAKFNKI